MHFFIRIFMQFVLIYSLDVFLLKFKLNTLMEIDRTISMGECWFYKLRNTTYENVEWNAKKRLRTILITIQTGYH